MKEKIAVMVMVLTALACTTEAPAPAPAEPAPVELASLALDAQQAEALFEMASEVESLGVEPTQTVADSGVRISRETVRIHFDPGTFPDLPRPSGGSVVAAVYCAGFCVGGTGCDASGCQGNHSGGCTPIRCTQGCSGGSCSKSGMVVADQGLLDVLGDRLPRPGDPPPIPSGPDPR